MTLQVHTELQWLMKLSAAGCVSVYIVRAYQQHENTSKGQYLRQASGQHGINVQYKGEYYEILCRIRGISQSDSYI